MYAEKKFDYNIFQINWSIRRDPRLSGGGGNWITGEGGGEEVLRLMWWWKVQCAQMIYFDCRMVVQVMGIGWGMFDWILIWRWLWGVAGLPNVNCKMQRDACVRAKVVWMVMTPSLRCGGIDTIWSRSYSVEERRKSITFPFGLLWSMPAPPQKLHYQNYHSLLTPPIKLKKCETDCCIACLRRWWGGVDPKLQSPWDRLSSHPATTPTVYLQGREGIFGIGFNKIGDGMEVSTRLFHGWLERNWKSVIGSPRGKGNEMGRQEEGRGPSPWRDWCLYRHVCRHAWHLDWWKDNGMGIGMVEIL